MDGAAWWRQYGHPVMRKAGFRQAGKKYVLEDGNYVVVNWYDFRLMSLKILIEWGVVPRPLLAFNRRNDPRRPLNFSMGLFHERMKPPEQYIVGADRTLWEADTPERAAEVGEALTARLTDTYVPLWLEIVHSDGFLAWFDRGGHQDFMFDAPGLPQTRELWYVAVHIDDGDPAELQRMIDSIPIEGFVDAPYYVQWWRERLAQRLSAS